MKNLYLKRVIIVILVVVIVILGVNIYIQQQKINSILTDDVANTSTATTPTEPISSENKIDSSTRTPSDAEISNASESPAFVSYPYLDNINCKDYPNYFVIIHTLKIGQNVLIKNKTATNQTFPCEYKVARNDYGIVTANFVGMIDHFVVTDDTDPTEMADSVAGWIKIYDLIAMKTVFQDTYYEQKNSFSPSVNSSSLSYWDITNIQPSVENCSQYSEWNGNVGMAKKIVVSIPELVKKDSGEEQCFYENLEPVANDGE